MSLGDLRSTFEEVQLFLSLTVGFPVYPLRMFFEAADDGVGHGSPLRMYFSQGSIDIPRPWPGAFHVLARDDFGDLLPEALDAWFEEAETHEPLRDLVLGGRYNPSHRPSLRFLTLTKALEGYHRRRHGGHYQTQENYEETRNHLWSEIPDGLTQGHRAALRSRIRYGYQYSLRKRLTDLIERTPPSMPPMIETDRSGFVDVVVDTRNQHTHHDPENEDDILEGEQLSLANDALEALATFLMLQDINAPDEQIVDGLSSSVRFNHLWDED